MRYTNNTRIIKGDRERIISVFLITVSDDVRQFKIDNTIALAIIFLMFLYS